MFLKPGYFLNISDMFVLALPSHHTFFVDEKDLCCVINIIIYCCDGTAANGSPSDLCP